MACGGFVLSDRQKDVLALFKDGEHLVTFDDGKDLVDKIKYFLQHPEERKKIAAAGRREVLNKHTYTHRIQSLLSLIRRPESEPSRGGISNCGRQREQVINFDQIPLESRTMQKRHKVIHIVEDLKVGGRRKLSLPSLQAWTRKNLMWRSGAWRGAAPLPTGSGSQGFP